MDGEPVFVCQKPKPIIHTAGIAVKPFIYKDLTMKIQPLPGQRFIRKTQLGANEYRKNFHQIDREIIAVITSEEADRVTPLMSKIYLRMVNAPERFWEREGVLRIESEVRGEKLLKAWAVFCDLLGVASATARKAVSWMHEQGIIGYFSGKNGVGLRVFLNRATSSIGTRQARGGEKILAFPPASSVETPGSANEPAFKDSFAVKEISDTDTNPGAPKNGADTERLDKIAPDPAPNTPPANHQSLSPVTIAPQTPGIVSIEEVIMRLRAELEPAMQVAARRAAAQEYERTREWLEKRGLPKAARVAQHEAYNVLRKYGLISEAACSARSRSEVGRSSYEPPAPHILSDEEVNELAQACVAMLETQGQSIEVTLSEMSSEAGGCVLPEDADRVRQKAHSLFSDRDKREGN
ncbi:MAG TPA: hypothetical protein VIW80_04815 [Pyrinomonadaceae bacterium]